jgi:hypothetical protein
MSRSLILVGRAQQHLLFAITFEDGVRRKAPSTSQGRGVFLQPPHGARVHRPRLERQSDGPIIQTSVARPMPSSAT